MNERGLQLARRRERLVQRSALLRGQVAYEVQSLQPTLIWVDRLQDAWGWVRSHPLATTAGAAALAAWRPGRLFSLGWRAWSAWKLVQRVRAAGSTRHREP